MDQISGTTPASAPPQAPALTPAEEQGQPAGAGASPEPPGFRSRGAARRRARFLRKARELAYRDLGGLVFNLHRFGQRNDALVLAKLTTLGRIDAELRALEGALAERRPVTVLREAGITACPRCAAIHSSEDRFCPNCGLSMGRHLDLPVAGAPAPADVAPAASQPPPTQVQPAAVNVAPIVAPDGPQPTPPSPPAPSSTPPGAPAGATLPAAERVPPQAVPPQAVPGANAITDEAPTSQPGGPGPDEPTEILRPGEPSR